MAAFDDKEREERILMNDRAAWWVIRLSVLAYIGIALISMGLFTYMEAKMGTYTKFDTPFKVLLEGAAWPLSWPVEIGRTAGGR